VQKTGNGVKTTLKFESSSVRETLESGIRRRRQAAWKRRLEGGFGKQESDVFLSNTAPLYDTGENQSPLSNFHALVQFVGFVGEF